MFGGVAHQRAPAKTAGEVVTFGWRTEPFLAVVMPVGRIAQTTKMLAAMVFSATIGVTIGRSVCQARTTPRTSPKRVTGAAP